MAMQFQAKRSGWRTMALVFLLCLSGLGYGSAWAEQTNHLYSADVSAEQSRQQWQRAAFEQVVRRVSVDPQVLSHPAIQQERQRANTYVKQFEAIRTEQGAGVRVLMDQQKIQQLFREHQLPIWDSRRPQSLIWLVAQDSRGRQFVNQRQHELIVAVQQQATERMLPLVWPLYDMEDLLSLNETDVWAGFWQQIRSASVRYQADLIITAQLSEQQGESGVQYQLYWQLDQQGRVDRFELQATELTDLAEQWVDDLANQLAERYAVRYTEQSELLNLQVSGVASWADWVQLQRLMSRLPGVERLDLQQWSGQWLQLELQLAIARPEFMALLALEPRLSLLTPSPATGAMSLLPPAVQSSDAIQLRFESP